LNFKILTITTLSEKSHNTAAHTASQKSFTRTPNVLLHRPIPQVFAGHLNQHINLET